MNSAVFLENPVPSAAPAGPAFDRPELELLVLAARRRLTDDDAARFRTILRADLDWNLLVHTANRHGVLPLLNHHLEQQVPASDIPVAEALQNSVRVIAVRTLQLTGTLLNTLSLFAKNGIEAVPYKGPALAQRVYGSVALRQPGDLDILIRREDEVHARALLLENGFTQQYPTTPGNHAFRLANRYSEEFIGPQRVAIELHWAFANRDIPFDLSLDDLLPRLVTQSLGGSEISAFSDEDLLLVLCVHGAKHRWDRLEWIASMSEAIRSSPGLDWSVALDRADHLKVRRTLLLGAALANRMLDVPLPDSIRTAVRTEPWVLALATEVQGRLFTEGGTNGDWFSTVLSRNLFQFPLQHSFGDRCRYLAYRLVTPNRPERWRTLTVAGRSFPIHAVTWPLRLGAKLVSMPFRYMRRRG